MSPEPRSHDTAALRQKVREFLAEQAEIGTFVPRPDCWTSFNREFSLAVAARGWVGMTIPTQYRGHYGPSRSLGERWAVVEELIAGGAPLGSHWVAERQLAPMIERFGNEEQRRKYLPRIVAGEFHQRTRYE